MFDQSGPDQTLITHRPPADLPADARLRDLIIAVRADEAGHRDKNHGFADAIGKAEHR